MRKKKRMIIFIMLSIMTAGTIMLSLRPARPRIKGIKKRIQKTVGAMDTAGLLKGTPSARIREFYDLMQWEAYTRSILKKDTLTAKDSIFLWQVNQRLNRLLYEED